MASWCKRSCYPTVAVQPPTKRAKNIETVTFVIPDFKDRHEKREKCIESPVLNACGYNWRIEIHHTTEVGPLGRPERYVRHYLVAPKKWARIRLAKNESTATLTFRSKTDDQIEFCLGESEEKIELPEKNFIEDNLKEDGSLVIEFYIQVEEERVWYPAELQQKDIWVKLYQDASSETSDAVFSVGETLFRVHKSVLSLRGKALYEMAEECDNDAPIPLHSVTVEIFKSVLDFIYTVKTPEIEDEDIAIELIAAATRYDCGDLKLYVESVIVEKFLYDDNAAKLLTATEVYQCPLIKEAAMNELIEVVKSTESWSEVREPYRLLEKLFFLETDKQVAKIDLCEIHHMDVTTLREALEDANLELDGSRWNLVIRLHYYTKYGDTL